MPQESEAKAVERPRPISAKSELLWQKYFVPMQSAAAALNSAIVNTQNIIGNLILEAEGVTSETHIFDADNMRIIPRPPKE